VRRSYISPNLDINYNYQFFLSLLLAASCRFVYFRTWYITIDREMIVVASAMPRDETWAEPGTW